MMRISRIANRRDVLVGLLGKSSIRVAVRTQPCLYRLNSTLSSGDVSKNETTTPTSTLQSDEKTQVSTKPWYLRKEFSQPNSHISQVDIDETDTIVYPNTLNQINDASFVQELSVYLQKTLGLGQIVVFDMVNGERNKSIDGGNDVVILASAKSGKHCIGSVEMLKKHLKHDCDINGEDLNVEGIVSSNYRKKQLKRLQRKGGDLKSTVEWFNRDSGDWIALELSNKNNCNILVNILESNKRSWLNLEELYCCEEDRLKYRLQASEMEKETQGDEAAEADDSNEDNILINLRKQLSQEGGGGGGGGSSTTTQKRQYSTSASSSSGLVLNNKERDLSLLQVLNDKWTQLSVDHSPNDREWELRLYDLTNVMEQSNNIHFYEVIMKQYLDLKILMGERMKLSELLKINVLCISHIYMKTEDASLSMRNLLVSKMMVKLLKYFDYITKIETMNIEKILLLSLKQVSGTTKFYSLCNFIKTKYVFCPTVLKNQILKEIVDRGDWFFLKKKWMDDNFRFIDMMSSWDTMITLLENHKEGKFFEEDTSFLKKIIKQDFVQLLNRDMMVNQVKNFELLERLNLLV